MVNLPLEVQTILFAFTPLFSMPVWQNACMLSVGAILSIAKKTAASALKVMGLKDEKHFTNCHQVLNMDEWNALNGAEILPGLIICVIPSAASDLPDDHAGQTLVTRSPHVFSRRRRLRCCKACPLLYRVFCACLPGISLISLWYTSGQNPVSIK